MFYQYVYINTDAVKKSLGFQDVSNKKVEEHIFD